MKIIKQGWVGGRRAKGGGGSSCKRRPLEQIVSELRPAAKGRAREGHNKPGPAGARAGGQAGDEFVRFKRQQPGWREDGEERGQPSITCPSTRTPKKPRSPKVAGERCFPALYTTQPSGLLILDLCGGCDPGRDPPTFQGSGCSQRSGSAPGNGANSQQHLPGIG